MYNLLTEEIQKKVTQEYRFRFFSLFCSFFAGIFFIGTILLLPSFMYVYNQKGELEEELKVAKSNQEENSETNFAVSARSVEEKIKILSTFGVKENQPDFLFEKIIEEKNNAIAINRISYTLDKKQTLIIEGVAQTRDDLLSFRNALRKKAPFTAADFPVELLAKEQDIRFSMTVQ